jgi:hypothetical protein
MPSATELLDLADQVLRLTVSHRDPEQFHIRKSEIVHRLRGLARVLSRTPSSGAETSRHMARFDPKSEGSA